MNNYFWRSLLLAMSFVTTVTWAQVSPDAGSLRQEIEKNRETVAPKEKEAAPVDTQSAAPRVAAGAAAATVTVKAFHFTGNSLLSEQQLATALAGFLNRPIDFMELQRATDTVTDTYRHAGWIVRAYLPPQDVSTGAVNISIIEALFGATQLDGAAPKRIAVKRLESIVASQQQTGKPLDAEKLDRALLLINDLPGIAASAKLAPGKQERQTDLVLNVRDDHPISGEITLDNAGSRFTGENRVAATIYGNGLFHIGDRIGATLLRAQGIGYAQLTGTAPIGYSAWRVGPHVSYLKYDLIASEFSALDIKGTSAAFGLDATYPLVRARTKNLYFSFSYDSARFNNEANKLTTTKYKVSTAEAGVKGFVFDNFGGGGINEASLSLVSGKADLAGSPNQIADALTTKVDGGFNKVKYSLSRQQRLTEVVSLYVGVAGQQASKNLDSSQKFYLGGASGVRAYPASEAGGDQGYVATMEGRVRLTHGFSVTGFYDQGQITVNRKNDFVGAATLNSYSLKGFGLAMGWSNKSHISVNASWSHRIGDNPRAAANGNDQDGSLKKDRFWLQASMSF